MGKDKWAGYTETGRNTDGSVSTRVTVGSEGYTHSTPGGKTTGHSSGTQHHHGDHSSSPDKGSFEDTGSAPSGSIIDSFLK